MFHINLSHGKYSANGPMVSFDMEWNRNGGLLLSRANFVTTLTTFNESFHGLQVPDQYHLVDGNVGAVLYHLQGPQTGPFVGMPNSGKLLDIMGGEFMQFDAEAKLNYLITIEEFGIAVEQLFGNQTVTSLTPVSLFNNPQTSQEFRQRLRDNMASLHRNFNIGQHSAIADLATPDVVVNADQTQGQGSDAFMNLFLSDLNSFPDKIFHDDFVLADGHLGAIESVWEGTQTGVYTAPDGSVIQPTGQPVRVRSLLFLEFNEDALIKGATLVHDEAVVARQLLENQSEIAYPLYP
jgi:predicted ester cyclase